MHEQDFESVASAGYIAVVGSSGTGKTTLLRALRSSKCADKYDFIPRFSTRLRRVDDDPFETIVIADPSFDALSKGGALAVEWARALPDGRRHRYGLPWSVDSSPKVFCANVEFLAAFDELLMPSAKCLIIEVWTPREIRLRRLLQRSPELSDDDVELNLRSSEIDDHARELVHERIDNSSEGIGSALAQMSQIMYRLLPDRPDVSRHDEH
jgi:ribose 1,5-bisphosphokinase PhnN